MTTLTECEKEYLKWLLETRNFFWANGNLVAASKAQTDIDKLVKTPT